MYLCLCTFAARSTECFIAWFSRFVISWEIVCSGTVKELAFFVSNVFPIHDINSTFVVCNCNCRDSSHRFLLHFMNFSFVYKRWDWEDIECMGVLEINTDSVLVLIFKQIPSSFVVNLARNPIELRYLIELRIFVHHYLYPFSLSPWFNQSRQSETVQSLSVLLYLSRVFAKLISVNSWKFEPEQVRFQNACTIDCIAYSSLTDTSPSPPRALSA